MRFGMKEIESNTQLSFEMLNSPHKFNPNQHETRGDSYFIQHIFERNRLFPRVGFRKYFPITVTVELEHSIE